MAGHLPEEERDTNVQRKGSLNPASDESRENDDIRVGDVSERAAVAVGRGAKVQVFNVEIPLLPVVVALVVFIVVLSLAFYDRTKRPEAMLGEFNVAVAEFAVVDENGRRINSEDGLNLANWLYRRLSNELSGLGINHYELWQPAYTGAVAGVTPEERTRSAEKLAKTINANVIVSGVIEQTAHPQVSLEFYVNNRGFENASELAGEHYLGNPILIALPFEPDQYQGIISPALSARTSALSQITFGLSLYAIDDFEGAIEYFKHAEETEGWLSNAGKEVAYLLLGNAYARWASKDKTIEHLEEASFYLDKAQAIKEPYARAAVTNASVLYLQALGDPTSGTVNISLLDEAEARFREALNMSDSSPSANLESKIYFGLGQIALVRYGIEGGDWLDEAKSAFIRVVAEFEGGNDRIQDLAAHSYARLGLIERLSGNDIDAVPLYEKSAELVSPFYQAQYLASVGDLYVEMCQMDLAIEVYDRAIQVAEANGDESSAEELLSRRRNISNLQGCQ